jgi:hypothetical protein
MKQQPTLEQLKPQDPGQITVPVGRELDRLPPRFDPKRGRADAAVQGSRVVGAAVA